MGTTERKKRDLEKRRRLILDRSRKLFFQKGYDNVSVEEICRAAEYGRSALYALFHSKEEIYANICLEGLDILAGIMTGLDSAREPDQALMQAAEAFLDFFQKHRHHYLALFYFSRHTYDRTRVGPELREAMDAAEIKALSPLGYVLTAAMETGQVRPMPVERVTRLFWAGLMGVFGSFICQGLEDQSESIREHCLAYADIYLRGIINPDPRLEETS
jgi:AcrR family transcriptional regulator